MKLLLLNLRRNLLCTFQSQKHSAGETVISPLFIFSASCYELSVEWHAVSCITRAECTCNPVQYFAILSTQRSGSGWFETLVNSHMNITSHGEIFSVKDRRKNFSTIADTLDKIYNLDWLNSASKNECTAAVGLKWMLNQVWCLKLLEFNCFIPSILMPRVHLHPRITIISHVNFLSNT